VIKPPASEQAICPSGTPSSRTPPGDYIWHAPEVHHMANGGPVTAANDAKLRDFAIRAVKAQPFGYMRAVLGGLALSVEWPRHPYPDVGTVYFYSFHRTPYPIPQHHSWVKGGTAYSDAEEYGHAIPSRVVRPVATLMVVYQRVFYTYGPLFGLIMLTGLGGVLRLRLRRGRLPRLSWSPRTGSMLPWATAVVRRPHHQSRKLGRGDRGSLRRDLDVDRLDQRPERRTNARLPVEAGCRHGRGLGRAAPPVGAR
jgi:hypothetical protein